MNQLLKNRKNGSVFYFSTEKFQSRKYTIRVLGKSILGKLDVEVIYPSYIGIKKKIITNATDITVPEGSLLSWKGLTKNTKEVNIKLDTNRFHFNSRGFSFSKKMTNSSELSFELINQHTNQKDSLVYNVNIVKDEYPLISVKELTDSTNNSIKYFNGTVLDDYGLKSLNFHYQIKSSKGSVKNQTINVRKVKAQKTALISLLISVEKILS